MSLMNNKEFERKNVANPYLENEFIKAHYKWGNVRISNYFIEFN